MASDAPGNTDNLPLPITEAKPIGSRSADPAFATRSEADEDEDIDATEATASPLVFISYRHDPDEPLATALKRLIARSIHPTPNVFVAGDGGPATIANRLQASAPSGDQGVEGIRRNNYAKRP